jgi:hypothetical protein
LVKKYLKLSDKDLDLNDKMKQQEIEDLNLAGKQRDGEEGIPGEEEGSALLNQPEKPDKNILNDSKKEKKKSSNKKKTEIITEPDEEEE